MQPVKYAIYKGISGKYGAVQFGLKPATETGQTEKGFPLVEAGCVFVECAPSTGPNQYDWNNKIIFALSVGDIGKVIYGLTSSLEVKLIHDPGAKSDMAGQITKNLGFTAVGDKGSLFSLRENNKSTPDANKNYSIPLSNDEVMVIVTLLRSAIPVCLGWTT